jgi:hypothetical protein
MALSSAVGVGGTGAGKYQRVEQFIKLMPTPHYGVGICASVGLIDTPFSSTLD